MATGLFNLKQVNQAISQGAWSGYIAPRWVEYLVVAGGGGGGSQFGGGGGGAGGLLTGIVTVAAGTSYSVTVGGGGSAGSSSVGGSGQNSVFGSIAANGGGGGGGNASAPTTGGSGGGGRKDTANAGASGILGQGNAGGNGRDVVFNGNGGGGGGAGTIGLTPVSNIGGNGGAGIASAISGTVTTYAGGGGGGTETGTVGSGGVGGGGNGGLSSAGTAGGGNTGGGGGGCGSSGVAAGAGGSGIVVVRYPGNVQFYTGGTVTYSNGYIVHNFTANGTLAPTTPTVVSEYQISRSLRFNSADSAYVARTFPSAGNRKTWTWSAWIKRSALDVTQQVFSSRPTASPYALIYFQSTGKFIYSETGLDVQTTQVFRDASAWYHLVIAIDTTQATSSDRVKFYVNGVQITAFSTATYPSQSYDTQINTASQHNLSGMQPYGAEYFSGYMTEVNFIDGQQLTPTSFGYVNPTTGIWSPAKFVGAYGTNGFYLNFSDNSNTTAATLGADYSGNGNNWTPNNFSVTAGAGNDSLVDSPTSYGVDTGVGGTVRGNYATLNPLDKLSTVTAPLNGNLQYNTANSTGLMRGTLGVKSAKWYYEATITTVPSGGSIYIGVKDSSDPTMTSSNGLGSNSGTTNEFGYAQSGYKQNNGTGTNIGTTLGAGDVLMVAYDLDGGYIWWGKNGTWISSGNPATGANPMFSTLTSTNGYSPSLGYNSIYTDGVVNFNFGQRAFAYTAPSGFKALCTQNLPTPTIGATSATLAGKYFNPVLYTGNGTTLSVTGVGFQPDWVWAKCRGVAVSHRLVDAVRGVTKSLFSNLTDAETTESGLTAFNSDGFTVGSATGMNYNGEPFVAWNWRASNATAVTNTAGSITSTVSANTTSGFSVVTYGANGTSGATVGHGLGTTPTFVIIKNRSAVSHWRTGTSVTASAASPVTGYLSTTSSFAADSTAFQTLGSTTITLGNSGDVNSTSGGGYVAYCFAPISGYSAFGSYTGNGSADGPFVFTGMRPAYVMIKRTDSTASWYVLDVARNTYNAANLNLYPNLSNAEATFSALDILSNGFKIRNSDADFNASGGTYFYMAFASNPFKYSLAR